MKKIIGVVGEAGSGKTEVSKILTQLGCAKFSLSDVLRKIATKIGLDHSRDNLINLGNALRDQFGPDILAQGIAVEIENADAEYVVIESIRNPEELIFLRNNFDAVMLGIVMDEKKKFELMLKRGREGDPKSWQEYLEFRRKELGEGAGKNGIALQECLDLCDTTIKNDGTLEELSETIREINGEVRSKTERY